MRLDSGRAGGSAVAPFARSAAAALLVAMTRARSIAVALAVSAGLARPAATQLAAPQTAKPTATAGAAAEPGPSPLGADDAAESARVAAIVGDLGLPALAAVTAQSSRDALELSDRVMVVPADLAKYKDLPPAVYQQGLLAAGPDGTGTAYQEVFWYQVPSGYAAKKGAVPLVVAYHGFGASANSVSVQSTIDEECNERGWLYVAPTGIDDKLFGSPPSQANTAAAIQWMIDHYAVDTQRIYMVGFSAGGGIAANFAATHVDPQGIRIAAVGIVSGSHDWACVHAKGSATMKALLEHPLNFGGPPAQQLAAYQASSGLHFQMGSYPPLPGNLLQAASAAAGLAQTPTYVTWDTGDTLAEVCAQQPVLSQLLASLSATLQVQPVSGTAVTHSWSVLDEEALFDFFAQHTSAKAIPAAAPRGKEQLGSGE